MDALCASLLRANGAQCAPLYLIAEFSRPGFIVPTLRAFLFSKWKTGIANASY
jgi:hypothetical protein